MMTDDFSTSCKRLQLSIWKLLEIAESLDTRLWLPTIYERQHPFGQQRLFFIFEAFEAYPVCSIAIESKSLLIPCFTDLVEKVNADHELFLLCSPETQNRRRMMRVFCIKGAALLEQLRLACPHITRIVLVYNRIFALFYCRQFRLVSKRSISSWYSAPHGSWQIEVYIPTTLPRLKTTPPMRNKVWGAFQLSMKDTFFISKDRRILIERKSRISITIPK